MKILLTGGNGFIGSHTCVELINSGHEVVIYDSLVNSSKEMVNRLTRITKVKPLFIQGDIRDEKLITSVLQDNNIDVVMHFAGLKSVGLSREMPIDYFDNNVIGTIVLLKAMEKARVTKMVFSSSATVYGKPESVPITESFKLNPPENPYARTKVMIESILTDIAKSNESWRFAILRYFNPAGAHESGLIGEEPSGEPNNLMPYLTQVAIGRLKFLSVYGGDYETPDGTGVRDYIHVTDLAIGHVKALNKISSINGVAVWNLGTGRGYSVMDIIAEFEKISGKKVPFKITGRRLGDIASCYADVTKARQELEWEATRDLRKILSDAWRWQLNNKSNI